MRMETNNLETYPNKYVLGFLFDSDFEYVLLIQKERPKWQKGKLNGIGGKIITGEHPGEALTREFLEETGLYLNAWSTVGVLFGKDTDATGNGFVVYIYKEWVPKSIIEQAESLTDEQVKIYPVKEIPYKACIPNLSWIIPYCLYPYETYMRVEYFD